MTRNDVKTIKNFIRNPIGNNKEVLASLVGCDILGNPKYKPCSFCKGEGGQLRNGKYGIQGWDICPSCHK